MVPGDHLNLLTPFPSPPRRRREDFWGAAYPGWLAGALTPGYFLEPLAGGHPSGFLELAR